jgi:hypothetical protein
VFAGWNPAVDRTQYESITRFLQPRNAQADRGPSLYSGLQKNAYS